MAKRIKKCASLRWRGRESNFVDWNDVVNNTPSKLVKMRQLTTWSKDWPAIRTTKPLISSQAYYPSPLTVSWMPSDIYWMINTITCVLTRLVILEDSTCPLRAELLLSVCVNRTSKRRKTVTWVTDRINKTYGFQIIYKKKDYFYNWNSLTWELAVTPVENAFPIRL